MVTGLYPFTQVRHRCVDCRKSWASITRAAEHRKRGCLADSDTRACPTCEHNELDELDGWICLLGVRDDTVENVRRFCDDWRAAGDGLPPEPPDIGEELARG